ncbi:MAG: ABC transporter permease [Lachnospiraceae bacterium]|nr:ABC transporter permease [Lachnospiraceae bacterium]
MNTKKTKSYGRFFTLPVIISLAILVIFVLCIVFAPLISHLDPNALDLANILKDPSPEHLLGTDKTGRDIFTRILYGGRTSLLSAISIVVISMIIGIPVGLFSGYYGGKIDNILMRICDIVVSFPALLLAFIFVSAFGRSVTNAVIALGIVYVPMLAKLTRSLMLVEKNKTYVEAAHSIGYSDMRIIFREILPNCTSAILVELTLDLGYAILDMAAMSFLGLGVQPPTSDWGYMLEENRAFLTTKPLMAIAPGIAIIILVVSLNIFTDGIQTYLDPSRRKMPPMKKFKRRMGMSDD